jgi:hypothetical protein
MEESTYKEAQSEIDRAKKELLALRDKAAGFMSSLGLEGAHLIAINRMYQAIDQAILQAENLERTLYKLSKPVNHREQVRGYIYRP